MKCPDALIGYFKRRLAERSTWAAISAAIPSAALMDAPWSWLALIAGIAVALTPSIPTKNGAGHGEPRNGG